MTFSKTSLPNTPFLIGIDGLPGSGKSTVATALKEATCGVVIPLDDFTGWQPDPLWREHFIANILSPLTSGATSLSYQPVSWWPDHHPTAVTISPLPPVVIIEGIEALHPHFVPYYNLTLLVDTDPALCLERGLERDKNAGDTETIKRLWRDSIQAALTHLSQHQIATVANYTIPGDKPLSPALIETIVRASGL